MTDRAMTAPFEIGIAVGDLDRMTAFYRDGLGCTFVSRVEVPEGPSRANGLAPDGCVVVRLQTEWGERIKLLRPYGGCADASPGEWMLGRAGVAYLTFIVRDLAAAVDRLKAHGARFVRSDGPVVNRPGVTVAFMRDPELNVVELVEYGDVAAYRPDLGAPGR